MLSSYQKKGMIRKFSTSINHTDQQPQQQNRIKLEILFLSLLDKRKKFFFFVV